MSTENKYPVYGLYDAYNRVQAPLIGFASTLEEAAEIVRNKYHGTRRVADYGHCFVTNWSATDPEIFRSIEVNG